MTAKSVGLSSTEPGRLSPRGSCRFLHERGVAPAFPAPASSYNAFVPPAPQRPAKHSIYKQEAGGILIIGALILILTLVRYWHHIAWSAR